MRSLRIVLFPAAAFIGSHLLACGASSPPPSPLPAAPTVTAMTTASAPPAPPPPAPLPAGVPDSPAGHQLAWVLDVIAKTPSEVEAANHFAPSFLAQVPAAKLVAVLAQLGQGAPWTLENVTPVDATKLTALIRSSQGPRFNVQLVVGDDARNLIQGLLFQPHTEKAASWDDVQQKLRAAAPNVNFLAATIDARKCTDVASIDPKKALAIGSTFKLYVLDALAAQIGAGKHSWDDTIPIADAHKSLPTGAMRDEPAGKTFTVRHFAEQMISMSDNTAADHLLAYVGRPAVEKAVKATGHATPMQLVPFLSTREVFALKLLAAPEERSAYVAGDAAHKLKILDGYDQRGPDELMTRVTALTKPIMIDTIEWFASPEDLCKVMLDLHQRSALPATAPVASILSMNPGIPDEARQYGYVGYKGGGEPGVLNMTWLLQRARDGQWLFLSAGFNDPNQPIDQPKAIAAVSTAREFLGR